MRHFIHLKIGFLLLVLFLINSACQRIDYTLELKQVDSLHQEVNHLLVELDSIDSTTLMDFSLILDEDTQWLSDSLSQEDILLASDFLHQIKTGRLLIRNFPSEYEALKNELELCDKQLTDLKVDLKNSSIKKEEAMKYIQDEEKALQLIASHQSILMERIALKEDYNEVKKDFYLKLQEQRLY